MGGVICDILYFLSSKSIVHITNIVTWLRYAARLLRMELSSLGSSDGLAYMSLHKPNFMSAYNM